MSRYQEILAVQPPFDIGGDVERRPCFSCNFNCLVLSYTGKLEKEIAYFLSTNGFGSLASVIWYGKTAPIPSGPGPLIHLFNTGGGDTDKSNDGNLIHTLSFQVIIRAAKYDDALSKAFDVWRLLDNQREIDINSP